MSLHWRRIYGKSAAVALGAVAGSSLLLGATQVARSAPPTNEARADAIAVAQTSKEAPVERPEQKKTAHDLSDVFNPSDAAPSSEALNSSTRSRTDARFRFLPRPPWRDEARDDV